MKSHKAAAILVLALITAVFMLTPDSKSAVSAGGHGDSPALPDPYLVKNINPQTLSSNPRCHKIDSQRALCLANDFEHDFEPWLTDGTEEGTFLLKEITPGSRESYEILDVVLTGSGSFYFTSYGFNHSTLWLSDGTTAGTVKVVDFCSEAGYGQGSEMRSLVMLGDTLYFAGYCIDDLALWKSRGTAATTQKVVTFQGFDLDFFKMVTMNDRLYYIDSEGTLYGQYRLWQSDGTAANTILYSEHSVAWKSDLLVFNDRLYYLAKFGQDVTRQDSRWSLASTDGSGADPLEVKQVRPGFTGGRLTQFKSVDSSFFFVVQNEHASEYALWRSDGTGSETIKLATSMGEGPIYLMDSVGRKIFFIWNYNELRMSDGTVAGTKALKQFDQMSWTGIPCTATHAAGDSVFYFRAETSDHGCELWQSDGTPAGTKLALDMLPGPEGSFASPQTMFGDRLLFAADGWPVGNELWTIVESSINAEVVSDINQFEDASSSPIRLVDHGGSLYFAADDGLHGEELWRSGGKNEDTVMVKDIAPGKADSKPSILTSLPGKLVFQTYFEEDVTPGVWSTEGSEGSTQALTAGKSAGNILDETFGGYAFFSVFELDQDTHALHRTDGTQAGTIKLADLRHTHLSSAGKSVFYFSYFTDNENRNYGLAYTDGTAAGTKVVDGLPPCDNTMSDMATIGNLLLFTWCDENYRTTIWRLEGPGETPELFFKGTNIDQGSMTKAGDLIYFVSREPEAGYALWRSDGTAAGTVFIKPLATYVNDFYPFGDQLFFAMEDEGTGKELWVSDGTSAGTGMVKDIYPGGHSSSPYIYTDNGRYIFFRAWDNQGERIWSSDGTEGGTFAITGQRLGNKKYEPGEMMVVENLLFFAPQILAVEDPWYGSVYERELWAIDISMLSGSLTADFSASPTSGGIPLLVTFKNESSGPFDRCLWDFGDGKTATGCDDQTHTYTTTGSFTVTLTVSGPPGEDMKTRNAYISVYHQRCYLPATMKK